jgi:hypothetical protein
MNLNLIIAEFLPIVFFYSFLAYADEMIVLSKSPLGRFIAILVILFYGNIHYIYGLLICVLFILYYQSDMIEGFDLEPAEYKNSIEVPKKVESDNLKKKPDEEGWDIFDWMADPPNEADNGLEGFTDFRDIAVQNRFRQSNCLNGNLVHKSKPVRKENAEHIFPDLSFLGRTCNPCDTNCSFKYSEKLQLEEDLIREPKVPRTPPLYTQHIAPN